MTHLDNHSSIRSLSLLTLAMTAGLLTGCSGDGSAGSETIFSGRYVAFKSDASNLVAGDNNGSSDIFLHDTQTGTTTRVSVDSAGTEANDNSFRAALSADGRYVAFESIASNLVAGDNNRTWDIFLHDTQTGITTRVSVDSAGTEGNGGSYWAALSADGRYVAFESIASNLVAGDNNGVRDIFLHDTQTGITTRVSVDSAGTEGNFSSNRAALSAGGRYVAFESTARNLVAGDDNGTRDIFLHDTQTGTTTRVSVDSAGTEANGDSYFPALSADGRYVAFESGASNLVAGDDNGTRDIFLHDTQTGITTRVSVDSAGTEANGDSYFPALSADGRYVVFTSDASNLVAGDDNGTRDIFLHDTQTGTTTRVSVDSAGTEANGDNYRAALSADGRYVAFESGASNLVAGDNNGAWDVFLHDTQTGTTTRVSVDSAGNEGESNSTNPTLN